MDLKCAADFSKISFKDDLLKNFTQCNTKKQKTIQCIDTNI